MIQCKSMSKTYVKVLLLGKLSSDLVDEWGEVTDIVFGLEGCILCGDGVGERVLEGDLHAVDALVTLIVGEAVDSLTDDVCLLAEDVVVAETYWIFW